MPVPSGKEGCEDRTGIDLLVATSTFGEVLAAADISCKHPGNDGSHIYSPDLSPRLLRREHEA